MNKLILYALSFSDSPRNTSIARPSFGSVLENDNVTLICRSDANPAVQLYRWYKMDKETQILIGNLAVLSIKASRDTTRVFCEAKNDLGTDRSSLSQLDVKCKYMYV